ncbi:MAG: DUF4097 domain-containing protein [Bacteroidota bacterium]
MVRYLVFFLAGIGFYTVSSQIRLAHHEFEAENISKIKIYASFCDVKITHDQKIKFLGVIEGGGNPYDFNIYSELSKSGVLEIYVKHRGIKKVSLSKAQLDLSIPKKTSLSIESSSGDISGRDLLNGKYEFNTYSGDVHVSGIIGSLKVETTAGDIYVEDLKGDGVFATTSGDKKVVNMQGNIKSSTISGLSTFYNIMGDLKATATSGHINIKDITGSINVNTTSGNVNGQRIFLRGDSYFNLLTGNVSLGLNNPFEDFSFRLHSGGGKLHLGSQTFEGEHESGDGPIHIYSTTSSGNQDLKF